LRAPRFGFALLVVFAAIGCGASGPDQPDPGNDSAGDALSDKLPGFTLQNVTKYNGSTLGSYYVSNDADPPQCSSLPKGSCQTLNGSIAEYCRTPNGVFLDFGVASHTTTTSRDENGDFLPWFEARDITSPITPEGSFSEYILCSGDSVPGEASTYENISVQSDNIPRSAWQPQASAPRLNCGQSATLHTSASRPVWITIAAPARPTTITVYISTDIPDEFGSFLTVTDPGNDEDGPLTKAGSNTYHSVNATFSTQGITNDRPYYYYKILGGLPKATVKPWSNLTPQGAECSPPLTITYQVTCH
jgi:hypothetical protein